MILIPGLERKGGGGGGKRRWKDNSINHLSLSSYRVKAIRARTSAQATFLKTGRGNAIKEKGMWELNVVLVGVSREEVD